jgi:MFS transporter, MHS family, shikimate and dehydroshikimate transport protein
MSITTVAASSMIGTTIEWFDFFAYATAAALVLNVLFFPSADPLVGTILAFGGIAVGYFGRPLGSVVFGHFGDRVGRKTMLVISLLIMGAATFAIGLLPTYASWGIAAPILLMTLRFLQGFALGGEWGGAVLMVIEHAEPRSRRFWASFPQAGLALGLTLSTLCFVALKQMPEAAFQSWGWRVPFLLSAVLVLVGLMIRLKITETPEFEALREAGGQVRLPIVDTFRHHWRQVILAALCFANIGAIFYALFTFSVTYGTTRLGFSQTATLWMGTLCAVIAIIGFPAAGRLADRYGTGRVFTLGVLGTTVFAVPMYWLIDTGSLWIATLGYVLATVSFCGSYGTLGALYAEAFDVSVRYTGMSLSLGVGTLVGSAFVPMIYVELLDRFHSSWTISLYIVLTGVISLAAATLLLRLTPYRDTTAAPVTDAGLAAREDATT